MHGVDHRRIAAGSGHWHTRLLWLLEAEHDHDLLRRAGAKVCWNGRFWRESDAGDTLYIGIRYDYPEAADAFRDYDWDASNRSLLHYEDVYGVSLAASVVGTCPSCKQNSLQGVYVGRTHEARGHAEYNKCYRCAYTQYLGTYVYKNHGAGTEDSWTCPSCGSHTWCCKVSSQQAAQPTAMPTIRAFADRRNPK